MKIIVHVKENRIAEYRQLCNMTQSELADSLGVPENIVSSWEAGEFCPSVCHFLALQTLLVVNHQFVLGPLFEYSFKFGDDFYD